MNLCWGKCCTGWERELGYRVLLESDGDLCQKWMKGLKQNCLSGDARKEVSKERDKNHVIFLLRPSSTFWQSAAHSGDAAQPPLFHFGTSEHFSSSGGLSSTARLKTGRLLLSLFTGQKTDSQRDFNLKLNFEKRIQGILWLSISMCNVLFEGEWNAVQALAHSKLTKMFFHIFFSDQHIINMPSFILHTAPFPLWVHYFHSLELLNILVFCQKT